MNLSVCPFDGPGSIPGRDFGLVFCLTKQITQMGLGQGSLRQIMQQQEKRVDSLSFLFRQAF